MSDQSIGIKVQNPLILALRDHLKAEWEVYERGDDLYYLGWVAIALAHDASWRRGKSQAIKRSLEDALATVKVSRLESVVTGKVVREAALALRAVTALGGKVTKAQRGSATEIVDFARSRDWFASPQTAAIVSFSLCGDRSFEGQVASAASWLRGRLSGAAEAGQYETVADCMLGLAHAAGTIHDLPHGRLLTGLAEHSAERVAKALWFYSALDETGTSDTREGLVRLLEEKVSEKFHDYIAPELQLALFEGMNLVNSNLPPSELAEILNQLRAGGVAWAGQIDLGEDRLALANLAHMVRPPSFDAAEDALSYAVLRGAGHDEVYQLSTEEYARAAKSIRMLALDHKVTLRHLKRTHRIGWINIALGVLLALVLVRYHLVTDVVFIVMGLVRRQNQEVFALVLSSPMLAAAALGLLIWCGLLVLQLRLNDRLECDGVVAEPWWQLLPIISSIARGWTRLRGR